MHTMRQTNGLAGFTKRSESEYDCFGTGHSSTTISAGLGNFSFWFLLLNFLELCVNLICKCYLDKPELICFHLNTHLRSHCKFKRTI